MADVDDDEASDNVADTGVWDDWDGETEAEADTGIEDELYSSSS